MFHIEAVFIIKQLMKISKNKVRHIFFPAVWLWWKSWGISSAGGSVHYFDFKFSEDVDLPWCFVLLVPAVEQAFGCPAAEKLLFSEELLPVPAAEWNSCFSLLWTDIHVDRTTALVPPKHFWSYSGQTAWRQIKRKIVCQIHLHFSNFKSKIGNIPFIKESLKWLLEKLFFLKPTCRDIKAFWAVDLRSISLLRILSSLVKLTGWLLTTPSSCLLTFSLSRISASSLTQHVAWVSHILLQIWSIFYKQNPIIC